MTIPQQWLGDPRGDLKIALDRLASHPNTAPFISKQLIQRLVTSNPSDAYVHDITQVFRARQGDLRAVVKAILLHKEAREPAAASMAQYGKLREPVVKLAHLLRALPHTSDTYALQASRGALPFYLADDTTDPTRLAQTPMKAPSVFNFFRPGYTPPGTELADAALVAPEMQITSETTLLSFTNYLAQALDRGWGQWNLTTHDYDIRFDLSRWDSSATNATQLVDAIAQTLTGQALPDDLRSEAIAAVSSMPSGTGHTAPQACAGGGPAGGDFTRLLDSTMRMRP